MTTLFAPTALLPEGWADNVLVEIDRDGWIVGVDSFKEPPKPGDGAETVEGPLVPGMQNAHSHAFQRAMAGLTERASSLKKTFWNWRETMYRFLDDIGPDEMEAIAAQAYVEMLKGGYTSVAEFHYVHHATDGTPYDDRALLSRQVIRAALETGIGITHMPSLYAFGGFAGTPPSGGQKRFLNSVSSLMRIIEPLHAEFRTAPQVTMGLAHHSLRAVSPDMMRDGTKAVRALLPDAPIHILAAGQVEEVDACLAWSGQRPIAWLLDNAGVDDKWCFVHCTHADEAELRALAASGVTVALCPSAEANQAAGIFPLVRFFEEGGRFAIGSDSHVTLDAMQELRWLEYGQRLARERTLLRRQDLSSVGGTLYDQALSAGAQALGRKCGRIEPGFRADFLVLDPLMPCMTGKYRDHILDAAIFAASETPVLHVMAGGRWAVRNRHHKREEQVAENFRKVMLGFEG